MVNFGDSEWLILSEVNPVLPLPLTTFPINLPNQGSINLALIDVLSKNRHDGFLLKAVVNWSATFTPPSGVTNVTLNVPGFANATFEILLNGFVIYRVTQSIVQDQLSAAFTTAMTTFNIASLLFFDRTPLLDCRCIKVFTLRVTNISLVAPQVSTGTATTTATVGAATLFAEKSRRTPFC